MIPVNESNFLRLDVRTTIAIQIDIRIYQKVNGFIVPREETFSSLNIATNNVVGGLNRQIFQPFSENTQVLSVVLSTPTPGIESGECFVNMHLLNRFNDVVPMRQLVSGYITSSKPLSYPESKFENSLDGYGKALEYTKIAAPFQIVVPANTGIIVDNINIDSALANPAIITNHNVYFFDAVGIIFYQNIVIPITAGLVAVNTSGMIGGSFNISALNASFSNISAAYSIPNVLLQPGTTLIYTANNDDGNGVFVVKYRRWIMF